MSLPSDPQIIKYAWLFVLVGLLAMATFGILAWRLAERFIPPRVDLILVATVFGLSFAGATALIRGWV